MNIDDFWKRLGNYGVDVPPDVQRRVGLDFNQERVLIRPPTTASAKVRVLQYGTGVPSTYIARQIGISVRQVQKVRKMVRC
jgi:hypothetical protein